MKDIMPLKGLKAKREAKGYTQKEVAQKLGITLRNYQVYEEGLRKLPFNVAMQLEKIFRCKLKGFI